MDPTDQDLLYEHRVSTAVIALRPVVFISTIGEDDGIFNLAFLAPYVYMYEAGMPRCDGSSLRKIMNRMAIDYPNWIETGTALCSPAVAARFFRSTADKGVPSKSSGKSIGVVTVSLFYFFSQRIILGRFGYKP